MINKQGANLINKAGRKISEREIQGMIKRNAKVYNIISGHCIIKGDRVQIICPDNIQKYSLSFNLKDKTIQRKLKFDFGDVKGVKIMDVNELNEHKDAIHIRDIGFSLDLNKLPNDLDYLMEINYQLEDHRFMKSFVNTDKSRDAPYKEDDDVSQYWLEAHLNHPDLLKDEYKFMDLQDVDVGINVSVGQDIHMKLPPQLKDKMEVMVKLYKGGGRGEIWRNAMRLHTLQHGKYGGDSMDILDSLQDFFTDIVFSKYINVKEDFSYHDCYRGKEFHDNLPIHSWPRFMRIVSHCDLSVDKPAAKGYILYNRRNFIEEILKTLKIK